MHSRLATKTKRPTVWLLGAYLVAVLIWASPSLGQQQPALEERIRQLEEEQRKLVELVTELQKQIEELKAQAGRVPEEELPDIEQLLEPGEAEEVATGSSGDVSPAQSQNPDIWAAGEFVGRVGELTPELYDADGRDRRPILGNRSVELGLRYSVSTTADATLLIGDHGDGPELEEGYIDVNRERERFKLMLGRWRPGWGVLNEFHEHDLPFVSYPRSLSNYFGHAGLLAEGLKVEYLLPTHRYTTLDVSVLSGLGSESATALLPLGARVDKPSYMARLRRGWDIDQNSDIDLRLSYLDGANDTVAPTRTRMWNLGASWRRIEDGGRKGDRVLAECTLYDRDTGLGHVQRAGGYVAYVRKLSQRSQWGLMYDRAGFGDPTILGHSQSYNVFYTFAENESQRYRVQYRHARYPGGLQDNSVFVQLAWSIGPHFHSFK